MSKIALSGNASGTGTLTIAAPNTSTDRTLTLPDQTATLITNSSGVLDIGSGQLYKDASGNVGIGTSSPSERLNVVGGSIKTDATSRQIGYWEAGGINDGYYVPYNNLGQSEIINSYASGGILFKTGNAKLERARIDSSGSLLVATTSATVGSVTCAQVLDARTRNSGFGFGIIGNASNTQVARFAYDSTAVGAINVAVSSTSYATSSDYRLKHDIAPMIDALARVAALKPVTYKWNVDGSDGQGFIAHELQAVVPDAVVGEKDAVDAEGNPVYQGIDTSFLVATLTAAIQELKAIVDAQGAEIAALKGTA